MSRPLLAAAALSLGCKGEPEDKAPAEWLVDEVDLGQPLAQGEGYVFENGADAWFAAAQFTPRLDWDLPASDVPLYLWDLVQGLNIADEHGCPYTVAEGKSTTWRSDCRSQNGYQWTGEVTRSWGETGAGLAWTRWDMDLEVLGDVDDPSFDRVTLQGSVRNLEGQGGELVRAVQVNMRAGIDGYWERRSVGDEREAAWADWVVTGRFEQLQGDVYRFEGAADLGELGGLGFHANPLTLQEGCVGEPAGTLELNANQAVELYFEGLDDCDRCASYAVDGEFAGQACAPAL